MQKGLEKMITSTPTQDVYFIPSSIENGFLVYSPLRKMLFWANSSASEAINAHLNNGLDLPIENTKLVENVNKINKKNIAPPREQRLKIGDRAVFILSQKCNLSCTYCYAQVSRSPDTINEKQLATVINYILSSPSNKEKEFSFLGGGEPTITWDIFTNAIEYIKKEATKRKVKYSIGLTTNATLLNDERVSWLKQYHVDVGVSFDILPEIQNAQRCFPYESDKNSFDIVNSCIQLLIAYKMPPRIRSTITPLNVCLMEEMVAYVVNNYPDIKKLHFEHVTDLQLHQNEYYDNFISNFFIARDYARENGIYLRNSLVRSVNRIKGRFCNGEFCVLPTGEIVSCHRVSSQKDRLFNEFMYGHINDTININEKAFHTVNENIHNKPSECSNCFAQWHCAGICPYIRKFLNSAQLSDYCEFAKKMITRELDSKVIKFLHITN